ncbi:SusD/RagB family nutrient-binding outer membrane lipoprotein [Chitinophaga sp. 30R24]|uniref:SusD/RagB family nutrient-binding outer membrane lipoprotein n=1 Tax=Chitinophaga sp. 30R24 TaxID=3248838 RepID=UPI003B8FD4D1
MSKKIIIAILTGSIFLSGTGCKKFLDVNTDPSGAVAVNDPLLLSGIEIVNAFNIAGGYPARTAAFWTQQLAYNQAPPEWDTYRVTAPDVDNTWSFDLYPACLENLKKLEAQATAQGHTHFAGVAKVLIAFDIAVATDLWNDVPYSQAFQGSENLTPKYDTQESIYNSINTLLSDAITLLTGPDNSIVQPDAKDLVYGGDISKWTKFAYLLQARFALRLTYAPNHQAVTQAQAALAAAAKSFTSAADNAGVQFAATAGSEAPWYQFVNNWGSIMVSSTMINRLVSTNDPRLTVYADPNAVGNYVGRVIGADPDQTDSISGLGDFWGDNPAQTVFYGTYDEVLFIQAEATYLTSGFAAAQPILTQAVKAAMQRVGIDPNGADVAAYLAANCTLTASNAYEVIMTQKYLANFLSLESYNDWRRTNFPTLTVVENPYLGLTSIPRRWVYPASENQTNPQPEQPGSLTGRVWWDTLQ